ncbi:MAG: BA14K family protein [Hyphomicrobiales bacterium]
MNWCLDRYRSYDPASDTFVAYSGKVRRCRSPYSP